MRRAWRHGLRLRSYSLRWPLSVILPNVRNSTAFSLACLTMTPRCLRGWSGFSCQLIYTAETFTDPEEFLRYAGTHRPAVALIDVCMPPMSGLEVQSRLREISPSTRVIIFTGKDDPLVRSTALNAGASAFFTKPFDDEELLTAVRLAFASVNENLVPKL